MQLGTRSGLFYFLSVLALTGFFVAPAMAQLDVGGGPGGHWTGPNTTILWVATNGSDQPTSGSYLTPYQSIAYGVQQASNLVLNSGMIVTLNVRAGTYYELNTIVMPSRGLSLNAYNYDPNNSASSVQIAGQSSRDTIYVDKLGPQSFPHSIIQGFTLRGGNAAIRLNPFANNQVYDNDPESVRIRYCHMENNHYGVYVHTHNQATSGIERSAHIIDRNQFQSNFTCHVRIEHGPDALSSTLIRCNEMGDCLRNVHIAPYPMANIQVTNQTMPRIYSNFFFCSSYGSIASIEAVDCAPRIMNNTSGDRAGVPTTAAGFVLDNTSASTFVANNIIWHGKNLPGNDFVLRNSAMYKANNNNIEDGAYPPGGSSNFTITPSFESASSGNYHLTAATPGIVDRMSIVGSSIGSAPVWGTVGTAPLTMSVRFDFARDIDWEPRMIDSSYYWAVNVIDVGADEYSYDANNSPLSRLSARLPNTPNAMDTQNNIYQSLASPSGAAYPIEFLINGDPTDKGMLLFWWFSFTPDPLYLNYIMSACGNLMIDPLRAGVDQLELVGHNLITNIAPPTGTTAPNNQWVLTSAIPPLMASQMETEYYFQAFRIDKNDFPTLSNVLRIEIND